MMAVGIWYSGQYGSYKDDFMSFRPNNRIEPMTSSAVCQWFQFDAVDALLVTAHPDR